MKITSILSSSRNIAVLFVTLLSLAAALALSQPAGAATASASWKYWQTDGDRCWDVATMDADFNGQFEDARFDIDNDCRWDARMWNTKAGDDFFEALSFDMDENGVAEYLMLDINQRQGFEWLYIDGNQDGVYELRRIIPGSDLDAITRVNTYNASSAILHQFTMRTGQSLLYPSFPTP